MTRLIFIFSLLFLASCTEVPVNVPEPTAPDTEKVVLIEEITGVDCPNCPAGAAKIASLIEQFDGNVIGVSIHGSFLASPLSNSQYDFRSETADDLEAHLKPWFGKPAAVINRIQQEGQSEFAISSVDLWSQLVVAELEKPQTAAVVINHEYDPSTRDLTIDVEIEPWIDLSGDIRISIMLTESHVIDAQKDQSEIIPDYEHNHMLKTMLTAFDGDGLTSEVLAFNKLNRNYSYTLPEDDGLWIPENMDIIAFVSVVTPTSKEILQAAQVHIIE